MEVHAHCRSCRMVPAERVVHYKLWRRRSCHVAGMTRDEIGLLTFGALLLMACREASPALRTPSLLSTPLRAIWLPTMVKLLRAIEKQRHNLALGSKYDSATIGFAGKKRSIDAKRGLAANSATATAWAWVLGHVPPLPSFTAVSPLAPSVIPGDVKASDAPPHDPDTHASPYTSSLMP